MSNSIRRLLCFVLLVFVGCTAVADASISADVLEKTGARGGIIVHIGCEKPKLLIELCESGPHIVQALDLDSAKVDKARKYIQAKGLYGKISVSTFDGKQLPYADNLVNLIVIDDQSVKCQVSRGEIERVLVPRGVALVKEPNNSRIKQLNNYQSLPDMKGWLKYTKPIPAEIDEWTHHHHGADNNAVARDRVVGPPRHFQWIADPVWSRSHLGMASISSMVSAKGRLFSIEDHGSVENPALPGKFSLICRDAFNGIVLWRHPLPNWHPVNIFIKLTPSQLQRQLVAIDDKVYCTPGLNAPVTVFDAISGKILKKYDGTEMTQEFVYDKEVLFVVVGDPVDTSSVGGGKFTFGSSAFPTEDYSPRIQHRDNPRSSLVAIDAVSGRRLWDKKGDSMRAYQGASLAVRGENAVYATLDSVVCLDRSSGEERWRTALKTSSEKAGSGRKGRNYLSTRAHRNSVTLVLSDEAVYLAAQRSLTAFAMKDGAKLWAAPTQMNHHKPPDVLLTGGAVWTANRIAYDPLTGKQIKKLSQKVTGPMGHDRCYSNRITERWYINTVSGGSDFLGLDVPGEFPSPWARSTCGIGHLPCNGLLYLGPPACSCGNKVQLNSFNALTTEPGLKSSGQSMNVTVKPQQEKGPAYTQVCRSAAKPSPRLASLPKVASGFRSQVSEDWPTYRKDSSRSGSTRAAVKGQLQPLWQTKLGARVSPPVIVGDQIFVADVDAHAVCSLSADDGKVQWRYTTGGRVDSPPTWHQGRLLFGSHDGRVYCLRAKDGALIWRFKALPDRLICAYEQIESAWPVCGSILVEENIAYFVAGLNSFVDGGLFLFGVDPQTGRMVHQRNLYGPYDKVGHPVVSKITALGGTGAGGVQGNKGDILSARGEHLFLRHQAFKKNLDTPKPDERILPHLIPSHGFADGTPHHRSFWTIDTELYYDRWTATLGVRGDILVMDGNRYYEVRGYPPGRYTTYDVRKNAYTLFAGELSNEKPQKAAKRGYKKLWDTKLPLTGKAMALAADVLFVAGTPAVFPEGDLAKAYEGRMGGVLWVASAKDGKKLAEYKLDAPPVWDSLAAVDGRLIICTTDGRVRCFAGQGSE